MENIQLATITEYTINTEYSHRVCTTVPDDIQYMEDALERLYVSYKTTEYSLSHLTCLKRQDVSHEFSHI